MSEGNIEVCRRVFDAFGNRREVEGALDHIDPEVELRSAIVGGAEGRVFHGHDGLRAWMAESDATWSELRVETNELHELGDGRVLIIGHIHATGRESGLEIDAPVAWLYELRDGKILHTRGYLDLEEARRDAGLAG